MNSRPFITAAIVVRNEENYIGACLKSLLEQTYPKDRYEIIIVDGASEDGTMKVVDRILDQYDGDVDVRRFVNFSRTLAAGWNIAIRNTDAKYVVRLDAHTIADPRFLECSMDAMLRTDDAVCVGGPLNTVASSRKGEIVANIMTSPFGIGNSKFRYSKEPQYVDTVAFGLMKRSVFDEVGYLDESLKRCQDNDLHRRIREHGGKFYMDPSIKVTYFAKDSAKKMLNQGFRNGKWTMIALRKNKHGMAMRYFVPLMFLLGLLGSLVTGLFNPVFYWLGLGIVALHLLSGLVFAAKRTRKISHILIMPFLFFALHFCYGAGSVTGIFWPMRSVQRQMSRERTGCDG